MVEKFPRELMDIVKALACARRQRILLLLLYRNVRGAMPFIELSSIMPPSFNERQHDYNSQLYYSLKKLTAAGLVESRMFDENREPPWCFEYNITPLGKRVVEALYSVLIPPRNPE